MKRIRSWRWMARRRWRNMRAPMSSSALLAVEVAVRASLMGGNVGSCDTALMDCGTEMVVETEPRA